MFALLSHLLGKRVSRDDLPASHTADERDGFERRIRQPAHNRRASRMSHCRANSRDRGRVASNF
jgi:hypothetical protein